MLSKNQLKFINSLKEKKIRRELGLFIVEGEKSVEDFLESGINVKTIYATKKWDFAVKRGENSRINRDPEIIEVTDNELKKISNLSTPNEVLAVCGIPEYNLKTDELKDQLTLMLDDIKDPGNLGTIIRIADWFGIKEIICSLESVDSYNPKTVQATMGSLARVKVHYENLEKILKGIKVPVYGAVLEGNNIYKTKLEKKGIIVIGNESNGISEKLIPLLTQKITIPSFNNDSDSFPESLNAAVAAAVMCSEFRRNGK